MQLNVIWYVLFVVIIAGYVGLDGFDMGVGILHLLVAKTDEERRISLNSIGALFAAFPMVYASLFSGFYTALMLVLLVLILRTVAIEFRRKQPGPGWRMTWDFVFWFSSLLMAVLFGVAFGNVTGGVALDRQGNITSGLIALLNPFALLIGVTTVFLLAMHGGVYLTMKTKGALQGRVRRLVPGLMLIFVILNTLVVSATFFFQVHIKDQYLAHPALAIFPALALAAMIAAWLLLRRGNDFRAFLCSGVMIMCLILSVAAGLFPNLLVFNMNPGYNLTAFYEASEPNTLMVMLIIAIIGMPFVLLYTSAANYIFGGKVVLGPRSY
jgi:cytochrome bd ubiquinol oxidase subunit II